ncbi:MAG: DoxX family protein [Chloroflexi bacterium]|nr:DoxX family protein [Chloroflexota bacterium]
MQEQEAQPGIFGGILEKYADEFWLVFRVVFAILVFLHGIQKAFLLWDFPAGANPNGLGALVDIAGWVELISALLIGFGLLTRLGAGALCVTMLIAYFGVHMALSPVWPWPHLYPNPPDGGNAFVAHGGEVTILWFIVAGVIGVIGGGKYALDKVVFKREPL